MLYVPKRLEFWSILPRTELLRRVQAELRRTDLTFAQTQLLNAAQERLRSWRAPIEKARGVSHMNLDDNGDKTETKNEGTKPEASVKKPPAKKPAAKKPANKKPAAKKAAPKKAAKAGTNGRIDPKSKVIWTGKENPFREGSGSYERTELVRKASGKMFETIVEIKGIKPTTVSTLKRMQLVRIEK